MKESKYYLIFFVIVVIIVYLFSISPAYNSDDSPETTLAFYSLGIQHPPGYPLNTLIGKLFTFIPLGSLMLRANLMAMVFNILTGIVLFFIIFKFVDNSKNYIIKLILSFAGVTLFLFSPSVWMQGISAKGSIYALNSFLTCLVIYFILNSKLDVKFFYLACFIYGLALGNHWMSMIVILPAFVIYIFLENKKIKISHIFTGSVFLLIGISVYLFVFLRSQTEPIYAWGDTKTIKDFIWLISRSQYAGLETKHTITDTINLSTYYSKHFILKEYPYFGLLFLLGMFFFFKEKRNIALMLASAHILLFFSVVSFATPPEKTQWLIKPYLASANIYVTIFIIFFVFYLINKLSDFLKYLVLIPIFGGIIAFMIYSNPGYSRYFIGYDYSKNMIKNICCDSILVAEGDMNIGAILYETLVNKADIVPLIPVVMQYEWYRKQVIRNFKGKFNLPPNNPDLKSYIESVIAFNKNKKIYYTNVATSKLVKDLKSAPDGVFFRITEKDEAIVNEFYFLTGSFRGKIDRTSKYDDFTQRLVFDNYATGYFALSEILRNKGKLVESLRYFKRGFVFQQNSSAYINFGLVYYQLQDLENAEKYWKIAAKLDPKNSIAYSNLAFIYIARNDMINAKKMIEKALVCDPNNQTALNIKQKLYMEFK